jgi:hypothetical protein
MVYRLPYGANRGVDVSNDYSAIVYPVATYSNGVTGNDLRISNGSLYFGAPVHVKLTEQEYLNILRGNAFTWKFLSNTTGQFADVASLGEAGLVILNKSQSTINTKYEGYYVGIIDNTNLNPSTPYDDVTGILSLNTSATYVSVATSSNPDYGRYVSIPDVRLNFPLSASSAGLEGSVSEVMENIPSFDISNSDYNDTVAMGVFKLRQSVFSPNTIALDYLLEEAYVGSLDFYRQQQNQNGGPAISFFLENIDDASRNIATLVNPYISNKDTGTSWLSITGTPQKTVRFLSAPRAAAIAGESAAEYEARMGAPEAVYTNLIRRIGSTDKLVALGDYSNQDVATKVIGNVPAKVETMLEKVENAEIYPLSITVEAGLGTIYANSFNPATSGYFDDFVSYESAMSTLTGQSSTGRPQIVQNYLAATLPFVSFAKDRRKDHMFIADPLTNIFVQGQNVKTLDDPNKNFSSNIYWPLRNQFSTINNSYVAIYGNVARVSDVASNRQVWVPFSGFAAGAMANTDANTQPWFAPAGFTRGLITGVTDLGLYPKQTQRDSMYKISINPVVYFPNEGFVIFGQKTAQKTPSAFDRINVRRLFLDLEVRTRDTVRFYVFEPNSLFTRTQVKNVLTPIFDLAKNTQGLYDYLIICDERNNTPQVIDENTLVVDIYLKPVRAAEFILVNFYATRTGTNFQEIVS